MRERVPIRSPIDSAVVEGPSGGLIRVVTLECGHVQWKPIPREPKGPPRPRGCVMCWYHAKMIADVEAADPGL